MPKSSRSKSTRNAVRTLSSDEIIERELAAIKIGTALTNLPKHLLRILGGLEEVKRMPEVMSIHGETTIDSLIDCGDYLDRLEPEDLGNHSIVTGIHHGRRFFAFKLIRSYSTSHIPDELGVGVIHQRYTPLPDIKCSGHMWVTASKQFGSWADGTFSDSRGCSTHFGQKCCRPSRAEVAYFGLPSEKPFECSKFEEIFSGTVIKPGYRLAQ